MTKLLVICLGVILWLPVTETFNSAERIGHLPRAFFRFETSVAKYTIRYDGFVEAYINNGTGHKWKRVFRLNMARGRLERVYFIEHEGDLLLRYDVMGHGSYLMRMEQIDRKQRWVTAVGNVPDQAPTIYADKVIVSDTLEISKADGRMLRQD